jgi:hypothetical protein
MQDLGNASSSASEQSGRSLNQETELRIERSFDREELLPQVLTLAYGEEIAGHLMRLGGELKTRADREGNPFELALAVIAASHSLADIAEKHGFPFPRKEMGDALEVWLKDFIVPDWRRAGDDMRECRDRDKAVTARAEAAIEEAAQEKFQAKIIQFRKRAS